LQAALEEANKRQLRRKPRRKYGIWPFHEDDVLMPGEEEQDDIEDNNYDPKCKQRHSSTRRPRLENQISRRSGGRLRKRKDKSVLSTSMKMQRMCVSCFPKIPFQSKVDFSAHITSVHSKDGSYFCTSCPLTTKRRGTIVEHRCSVNEPDLDNTAYQCFICSPISKWPDMTSYHIHAEEHKANEGFTCPNCSYDHTELKEISTHIMNVHLNGTSTPINRTGTNGTWKNRNVVTGRNGNGLQLESCGKCGRLSSSA